MPSLNHLISGDGNAVTCASKLIGSPIFTFKSRNEVMNAGFIGSAGKEIGKQINENSKEGEEGDDLRLIATAHRAALSPFGFEMTSL